MWYFELGYWIKDPEWHWHSTLRVDGFPSYERAKSGMIPYLLLPHEHHLDFKIRESAPPEE